MTPTDFVAPKKIYCPAKSFPVQISASLESSLPSHRPLVGVILGALVVVYALLCVGCNRDSRVASVLEQGPQGKLTITLLPRLKPTRGVAVIYELSGPAVAKVRSLAIAPSWAGTRGPDVVRYLLIRDERGLIDIDPRGARGTSFSSASPKDNTCE